MAIETDRSVKIPQTLLVDIFDRLTFLEVREQGRIDQNIMDFAEKLSETKEKVIEQPVKRGRGRPRVHPVKDPNAPKRKVGRPRKFKLNLQN